MCVLLLDIIKHRRINNIHQKQNIGTHTSLADSVDEDLAKGQGMYIEGSIRRLNFQLMIQLGDVTSI